MRFTAHFPYACFASMHFTLRLPYACLHSFHCLLPLRLPLLISLPTFPAHTSTRFTPYLPNARRYTSHCLLCAVHLTVYSARASMHFTVYLPCACLYAFHCLLALRMPLCISLSTFPARASMQFTVYFPCAYLYALHCACKFPTHASKNFTLRWPYACLYAFHRALSRRMPLRISRLLSLERNDLTGRTLRDSSKKIEWENSQGKKREKSNGSVPRANFQRDNLLVKGEILKEKVQRETSNGRIPIGKVNFNWKSLRRKIRAKALPLPRQLTLRNAQASVPVGPLKDCSAHAPTRYRDQV